jgi:hypothetical protein
MKMMQVLAVPGVAVLDYAFAKAHGRFRLTGRKLIEVKEPELRAAAAEGSDAYVGPTGELALPKDIAHCDVVRQRRPVDLGDVYYVEAWMLQTEPTNVPAMGEAGGYYMKRVREGGLLAANKETADLCGVKFVAPTQGKPAKKGGE